jgi:cytochrome bd ubiquinol oxidase subunit I
MDTLLLSRIQFAANISFHILFPTITIALGWVLLFFRLRFSATRNAKWMDLYMFWVKVFALSFALGVVSGITMSFQFGTNWPGFMEKVGNVAGPLLAYEVLTAFFLEAVFLGIMLFGASRVKPWVHVTATFLVAFGTTMSAFWIIVLNSWMQTPQGFELRDGIVHATDWFAIIFNPSMPYRLVHMLLASGLTVAFLIAGLSAWRLLMDDRTASARTGLRFGLVLGAVLFAIPDEAARTNRFEIAVPSGASIILKHSPSGVVPGLNDFVAEDGTVLHPPVAPLFYSFRVMVGIGFLMLAMSFGGVYLMWRRGGPEYLPRVFLWGLTGMTFAGWAATLAGWYTTEIGRQPWLVSGVLSTKDAVGDVAAGMVASTLIAYLAIYALLLVAYVGALFHLAKKAGHAPALPGLRAPVMVPGE